jgi:PKD repeat protein
MYTTAGSYTVTLTASNAAGSSLASKSVYVKVPSSTIPKPVANFWGSPKSGNSPLSVTFTDISTGEPTSWRWDFGDGTYSTLQKPAHKYAKSGVYSVTLTVNNAAGTATMTKHNYIAVST